MQKKYKILSVTLLLLLVLIGVYSNVLQQKAVDRSKIPQKIELSRGFQRWITNLKNKNLSIEADEFRLLEEVEVYNSKWTSISFADNQESKAALDKTLEESKNTKGIVIPPSKREILDYRNIERAHYKPNEVRFYGQKEDKIIDTKILDCSLLANCYFDRAFFINNDYFVISEFSRNINKKDTTAVPCTMDQVCAYTIKLHVIDLIKNSHLIYESKPIDTILAKLIPQL